ncbi:MAG: hypothetical protein LAP61_13970 [Acidobacteriia bacterium]|nr:hypothetical protein [Terriglobia bacterium]
MSTEKRIWIPAFYWIGVAMALACFGFVLAGSTELVWRFEHRGFPLSWALAGASILAFLGAEFCHSAFSLRSDAEDGSSQPSPELAAAESES